MAPRAVSLRGPPRALRWWLRALRCSPLALRCSTRPRPPLADCAEYVAARVANFPAHAASFPTRASGTAARPGSHSPVRGDVRNARGDRVDARGEHRHVRVGHRNAPQQGRVAALGGRPRAQAPDPCVRPERCAVLSGMALGSADHTPPRHAGITDPGYSLQDKGGATCSRDLRSASTPRKASVIAPMIMSAAPTR